MKPSFLKCFILIQSLILISCGGGFHTNEFSADGKTNGANSSGSAAGNGGAGSVVPTVPQVNTTEGSLAWQNPTTTSNNIELQFQMKIPFQRLYRLSSTLIRSLVPYSCQYVPGILKSHPSVYNVGEIPCGTVSGENQWKQVLAMSIDPIYGSAEGFKYSISGVNFPIWMSRPQRTGPYSEASLDSKSTVTMTSSPAFGEDLSFRYTPTGKQARFELCLNVPGSTITSSQQTIEAKASRNVFGLKISYGSKVDINPGQASFDYARGCFAMDFGWTQNNLAPEIHLASTKAPYLYNATYAGLQIKLKDWFLRLIDSVMNFFRTSLRKKAEAQGIRTANSLLDQDVETGRWFTKIHGENMVESAGRNMTNGISKSFRRIGIPATSDDLKAMIVDSCRLKRLGLAADWTSRLETFCRDVITKIEINIEPFAVDASSSEKGCYSYFARIHDSKNKWWANECKFASNFKIKIPLDYKDFQAELKLLLSSRFSLDRIPTEWRSYVQSLGVDEWTLALLLEELERIGYNQVNSSDWQNRISTIINQVRNQQSQLL